MPFRAAKQPVWHCNMARLAGLYGPFGLAGPRPFATLCMPARWPMRLQPPTPQPKRRLRGRAAPPWPGLCVAFGCTCRSCRAVGKGVPRVSSRRFGRRRPTLSPLALAPRASGRPWPRDSCHKARRAVAAREFMPPPVAQRRRARVCYKKNTICLRIFTPFFFENRNDWITFATVID